MPVNVNDVIKRYEAAKGARDNWEWHWQEIAELVLPTRDFTVDFNDGDQRRNRIYNEVAPDACESLASALSGMLTNTSIRWFSLTLADYELAQNEEAKVWLYDTTTRMLDYFDSSESGFATNSHEIYLDLCAFGTGVMLVRRSPNSLTFQARQLSNFYMTENDAGERVECYRRFKMTALEAYEVFGDDLHEKIIKAVEEPKNRDKKWEFIHAVIKRSDRDPLKVDSKNMPFASIYIDIKNKELVREGGFSSMPYLVPRWSKAPEEVYGRSPSMKILPGIKMVNAMSRAVIEASELAIRPPLLIPANSIEGPIRTTPGSIMYTRSGTRELPQPLMSGARPDIGEGLLAHRESRIEKAYFLDTFKLPDNDRMTATEIIERRQQGLLAAAPMLSRLYEEWLNPVIQHVFEWMRDTDRLMPMPDVIADRDLNISYRSPMALSKKQSQGQSFMQAMSLVTPLVQVNPAIMDNLNADIAFRDLFDMNNVDPSYLRSSSEVMMGRQQQAQQEQQMQQAQLAQQQASASRDAAAGMKDISEVPGV